MSSRSGYSSGCSRPSRSSSPTRSDLPCEGQSLKVGKGRATRKSAPWFSIRPLADLVEVFLPFLGVQLQLGQERFRRLDVSQALHPFQISFFSPQRDTQREITHDHDLVQSPRRKLVPERDSSSDVVGAVDERVDEAHARRPPLPLALPVVVRLRQREAFDEEAEPGRLGRERRQDDVVQAEHAQRREDVGGERAQFERGRRERAGEVRDERWMGVDRGEAGLCFAGSVGVAESWKGTHVGVEQHAEALDALAQDRLVRVCLLSPKGKRF